jgi:hypothetical protein
MRDDFQFSYRTVATEWSEYLPIETDPFLEDADAGAILGSLFK